MADVLNRATKEQRFSVNTPDYSTVTWIINPDLSGVVGVLKKYWKITGDIVSEMSQPEKDAVDDALLPGRKIELIDNIHADANSYIIDKYPNRREILDSLLNDSIQTLVEDRKSYLLPWRKWVNSIYEYVKNKDEEINSAATLQIADAITWDFSPFDTTDPQVNSSDALALSTFIPNVSDLWVPAQEMVPNSSKPAQLVTIEANGVPIKCYAFTNNKINRVFLEKVLKGWVPGESIQVTFYWLATSGSGSVLWSAAASANSAGPFNEKQEVQDAFSLPNTINTTITSNSITVTRNPVQGNALYFIIERKGSRDTFNKIAYLAGITLEYASPQPNI